VSEPNPNLIPVRIAGTSSLAPGRAVSTTEIVAHLGGKRDPAEMEARTGIASRSFVDGDASSAKLGGRALSEALEAAKLRPEDLARIIFVSSVGGDVLIPAVANLVAAELGLAGSCDCFDLNNACMGFLTAFDIAARSIALGGGPVGIVVVEIGSRFISPDDPRPYLVVADAVAAAVLDRGRGEQGILGSFLRNDPTLGGDVQLIHPGVSRQRETIRFFSTNDTITRRAIEALSRSAEAALADAGLALSEIEWVLPHQPNGQLFAAIVGALGIDPDRVVPVVRELGSVGAASIPTSLDRLMRTRDVRVGDRVLMVGVGAGAGYGALVLRV
jgi:3-oxoacyl-[acyl-carrier-protein] synthase III